MSVGKNLLSGSQSLRKAVSRFVQCILRLSIDCSEFWYKGNPSNSLQELWVSPKFDEVEIVPYFAAKEFFAHSFYVLV
jgi:hypothetical protein